MDIQALLIAVLSGGGVVGLVEFFVKRHDAKKGKMAEILKTLTNINSKVDDLEYKVDHNEAVMCRARILRFNKELVFKEKHTHEEFGQALEDCDKYETFCISHPNFKNNRAVLSIQNIKRCYEKCEADGDFL